MNSIIESIDAGKSLSRHQAETIIDQIIKGAYPQEQVGELLLALRKKQETSEELLGFVDGLSKKAHLLKLPNQFTASQSNSVLMDVCGTGGDSSGTVNVSTGVALVLASAGLNIAKHGNRGVSSKSGSSDVLEVLGLGSDTTPEQAIQSLQKLGTICLLMNRSSIAYQENKAPLIIGDPLEIALSILGKKIGDKISYEVNGVLIEGEIVDLR